MNDLVKQFGEEKRWVNYKIQVVDGRNTKIPYSPITGRKASSTKESDWGTYNETNKKSIGIVFTPEKNLLGVDIDHCLEGNNIIGDNDQLIAEFLIEADTYTEISPSGTGLHLFLKTTEPLELTANRHDNFECYTSGRYFTVTQNIYQEYDTVRTVTPDEAYTLLNMIGYPWQIKTDKDGQTQMTEYISDDTILEKMFSSKNGDKIKALYDGDISEYDNNDSSGDMALCSHLAFWTGNNPVQMERIWLASPLGNREKTQKREDYRKRTINNAIKNCTEVYEWKETDDIDYDFLYKHKGKQKIITLCLENIVKVLNKNPLFSGKFRFDTFKSELEMNQDGNWIQFEDKYVLQVQRIISNMFQDFQTVKKDMIFDAILSVAHENSIDSAIDYLKNLVWDGQPRLDTWLCSTYGVPNDEYHRTVGSNWLKGLVKRIVHPGCKFDFVLVLEGEQGTKKSTSLYVLGGDWHVETTMSTESKDFFMLFSGKAIIEFSEGETLSRTEVKRMKAIISTQNDKFRAPYDRVSKDHPRRCVFAMTTNSSEYLKDETGNRRWLPVTTVYPEANIEWLAENREQLFAEAYKRVIIDKETVWEFPREAMKEAQDARRISDPNSELVVDWYFNSLTEAERENGITTLDVHIKAFGNQFNKRMQKYEEMNIGNILREVLKLERKQTMVNGIRTIRWYQTGASILKINKEYTNFAIDQF